MSNYNLHSVTLHPTNLTRCFLLAMKNIHKIRCLLCSQMFLQLALLVKIYFGNQIRYSKVINIDINNKNTPAIKSLL